MAFFDNLGQKAKELAEASRLNGIISDEEKKISAAYCQLGKLYVASHPDDYEDTFAEIISSIGEANDRVAEYRKRLQDLKGVVRCIKCGAEVPRGAAFCSICGEPIPKVQETVDKSDLVKCESCGAFVRKGMRFCTACGKPMTPPAIHIEKGTESIRVGVKVRLCPRCGAGITEDAAFCTECGEPLERTQNEELVRCGYCGAMVERGIRFCTACGQPMSQAQGDGNNIAEGKERSIARKCPCCGVAITDDSLFCTECGAAIPQEMSVQEDGMVTCQNCGESVPKEAEFCTECGTPMKQPAATTKTEYVKEVVIEERETITAGQKHVFEEQREETPDETDMSGEEVPAEEFPVTKEEISIL